LAQQEIEMLEFARCFRPVLRLKLCAPSKPSPLAQPGPLLFECRELADFGLPVIVVGKSTASLVVVNGISQLDHGAHRTGLRTHAPFKSPSFIGAAVQRFRYCLAPQSVKETGDGIVNLKGTRRA